GRADAALVERIKACKSALIAHLQESEKAFPLTELQRAYIAGREEGFEIGGVASHVYHEIEGAWDIPRLERSLNEVVARHDMLRTRFLPGGGQVRDAGPCLMTIATHDLRSEPADVQQQCLLALRAQRSHRMLGLDAAPLLAVDVSLLADDRMIMHVSHDGVIMDGISMFLFLKEWWSFYEDPWGRKEPLRASFEANVRALAALADKPATQRARDYWLARLDDLPTAPQLPLRVSPAAIVRPHFVQRL